MARRKKRKFKYRGKGLEELKQLGIREFAKLLPSRQRRTVLRNFDVIQEFVEGCKKSQEQDKVIRTHRRDIVIVPELVGMTINVYNGQHYQKIQINERMLGHKLGEFVRTRKDIEHGAPGIGATRSSAALSVK